MLELSNARIRRTLWRPCIRSRRRLVIITTKRAAQNSSWQVWARFEHRNKKHNSGPKNTCKHTFLAHSPREYTGSRCSHYRSCCCAGLYECQMETRVSWGPSCKMRRNNKNRCTHNNTKIVHDSPGFREELVFTGGSHRTSLIVAFVTQRSIRLL